MEIEETTPAKEKSFATDLAQETTKSVVVTAATIAAAYGTALLVTSAWNGAKTLYRKVRPSKTVIVTEDTE